MQGVVCNFDTERISSLKYYYKNSYERIIDGVDKMEEMFNIKMRKSNIFISKGVRQYLEFRMLGCKRNYVDNIATEIDTLFDKRTRCSSSLVKKPKRFPKKIIEILESSFRIDRYPNDQEKLDIANICGITIKQVNNWFTNKRNRSSFTSCEITEYY
ncbi:hypothetical protein ENBRE01_1963 [Enteropsectra breve]|nr:hypothetical protein ENBRE01_1963 [Enteropsectra breve]